MVTGEQLRERLDYALQSILCFCGNHKRIDKPFCFQCFDGLPNNWRHHFNSCRYYERNTGTPQRDCTACSHEYDAACEWLIRHHPGRFRDRGIVR